MKKKSQKGFTLVELLATIAIISLVLGSGVYFALNIINNAKESSNKLALNSIKKTASIYVEEQNNSISWNDSSDDKQYTCISTQELINQGYFKQEEVKDDNYIIVTRDKTTNTIIKTEIDTSNTCGKMADKIKIPTSKVCKNLVYNPELSDRELISYNNEIVDISGNKGTDAGNYTVTFNLKDKNKYRWFDNTTEQKVVVCTIKKAIPSFQFNPNYSDSNTVKETISAKLNSNVSGKIILKTSNSDYAIDNVSDYRITNDIEKTISIIPLALRNNTTIITATLTPDDLNNYYSVSTTYTIGNIKTTVIEEYPICKDNIYYNGETKNLVNSTDEYQVYYDKTPIEVGNYTVIVKPKYGYVWSDGTTENYTLNCEILSNTYVIHFNGNGNTGGSMSSKTCVVGQNCALPNNGFSRSGYNFSGWSTSSSGSVVYSNNQTVKDIAVAGGNITLYAKWQAIPTTYTVYYDSNGGSGTMSSQTCKIGENCYLSSNSFSKTGYNFSGWNTSSSGYGTSYSNGQNIKGASSTLYLYAQWTRNFSCSYSGGTTYYAGKSWYTISNNGSTCELALNSQSSYTGSYNNASSNLRSEYFSSGQLKNEYDAGLISFYDSDSGTSSGLSGVYWKSSGQVYHNIDISSYSLTNGTTLYYGFTNGVTGPGSKTEYKYLGYSSTCNYNSCSSNSTSSISNSSSSISYNGLNTNQLSKERDNTYYTIISPVKTGSGGNLTLKLDTYRYGSFYNSKEVKAANFTFTECGGERNGTTIATFNFVSNNPDKYHYRNYAPSGSADYDYTDFTKTFYAAGIANGSGGSYSFYSSSTCNRWTYYTTSSNYAAIHYRLHIKVKI